MHPEQEKLPERQEKMQEENHLLKVIHCRVSLQTVQAKILQNVKFTSLREILQAVPQKKEETESTWQFFHYGVKCLMLKRQE